MDQGAFDQLNEGYLAGLLEAAPDTGTSLGIPDADERWPDPSAQGRLRHLEVVRTWAHALAALPEESLTDAQKADRRAFRDHARLLVFVHENLQPHRHDPDAVTPAVRTLLTQVLCTAASDEQRFAAARQRLATLGTFLSAWRSGVTEPDARWCDVAQEVAGSFGSVAALLRDAASRAEIPAVLRGEFEVALGQAHEAVAAHQSWLRDLSPADGPRWSLGPVRLAELFRLRGWATSVDDLAVAAARAVTDATLDRRRFARRVVPEGTVEQAAAAVEATRPASLAEAAAWVRNAADQARAFVKERNQFLLPPTEETAVMPLPMALRLGSGALQVLAAPRQAAHQQSVLLAWSESDPLPGLPRVESAALRWLIPGTHLLRVFGNTACGLLREGVPLGPCAFPATRWATETDAGWSRFVETALRRDGFRTHPAAMFHLAQEALLDACRARVDIELHCDRMTPSQARKVLVDEAGVPAAQADRDVFQITREPGCGVAALVGSMGFVELRRKARIAWATQDSPRRFHDFVLSHGKLPLASLLQAL